MIARNEKSRRQALSRSLELALLRAAGPCVVVGKDGLLRSANNSAAVVDPSIKRGRPVEEALGIGREILFAAAVEDCPEPLTALVGGGGTDSTAMLAQPLALADGAVLLLLSSIRGIRAAEEARFDKTPYGILRLDMQGQVCFANAAARQIFAGEPTLIGREFANLFDEAVTPVFRQRLQEVVAHEETRTIEIPEGFEYSLGERRIPSRPRLALIPDYAPGGRMIGVLVAFRERIVDAVRLALREAAAADGPHRTQPREWRDRLRAVLDELQSIVPHDRAIFGLLSHDRAWMRPILIHPPSDPSNPAMSRFWVPVRRDEQEEVARGPFTRDLEALVKADPAYGQDPMVRQHLDNGMVSHVMLPVPHDQPEAVLTLASKHSGYFESQVDRNGEAGHAWAEGLDDDWPQPPLPTLLALGLEPLLVAMLRRAEREDDAALRVISDSIPLAKSVPEAARKLLEDLLNHFDWDHVALFAVEPGAEGGRFRLFAQYPETGPDGAPHPLAIPTGYTQSLYQPGPGLPFDRAQAAASGMLGSAIRAGRPLVVSDTRRRNRHGHARYFFHSVAAEPPGSALTVPISLDGRTRWVLDTISRHVNAFREVDAAPVGRLVHRLARRVSDLRTSRLNAMLIELIDRGVVVTDAVGAILRANQRARDMLGLPTGVLPANRRLADHAEGATKAWLEGGPAPAKYYLGPFGGVRSEMRIHREEDQTETGDVVWLLDGADRQNWAHDRRYIEETVQEVARQVRAPLLLASSLAARLTRSVKEGPGPLVERVPAEISKADITFERLAETIGAKREPKRDVYRVDLAMLLGEIVGALPERDQSRIAIDWIAKAHVLGDRERLRFALRMLIGNLLAENPKNIRATLAQEGVGVVARSVLRLTCSDPPMADALDAADPLEQTALTAREAAGLGLATIQSVLAAHGGGVERQQDGFELRLPLAQEPVPS